VPHSHSKQWADQFMYAGVHAWACRLVYMRLCTCVCVRNCSLVTSPENYKQYEKHYFDGCSDGMNKKCVENCGKTC
jgi:hypothetical protein